jgi:homogentisate 1,2-dioxygenase
MTHRPSELGEALRISAALPEIQRQQLEKLEPLLKRIPISQLSDAIAAIEKHGELTYESLMRVRDVKVRVAEWEMRENRCEHKQYAVGNVKRARIGEIGDSNGWLEAWIA